MLSPEKLAFSRDLSRDLGLLCVLPANTRIPLENLAAYISFVVYLTMYNPLIVILCFLSLHIARFMLCVLYFLYFVYFTVISPCNSVRLSY